MDNRNFFVIIGSREYFFQEITDLILDDVSKIRTFLDVVKESDECRDKKIAFENKANKLLVVNDNYNGITEQAHDRIASLIEELTTCDADIYIHNPPITLKKYLETKQGNLSATIEYRHQKYEFNSDKKSFISNMNEIKNDIIGQNHAVDEVSKSIWYLMKANRKKPYVIMLYGNSSLGKTELVRKISKKFYYDKFFEKHLSMFQNSTYTDYFFGDKPNRRSMGYELLERTSNLIFLDEIDKCNELFYSAFYTLFDSTIFKDSSYEVDTSKMIIILTSNYQNERDIATNLGLPIYYRIDKFIPFYDFDSESIYRITKKEIEEKKNEYLGLSIEDKIYHDVSTKINSTGENARTIKQKVQKSIEELLFLELEQNSDV